MDKVPLMNLKIDDFIIRHNRVAIVRGMVHLAIDLSRVFVKPLQQQDRLYEFETNPNTTFETCHKADFEFIKRHKPFFVMARQLDSLGSRTCELKLPISLVRHLCCSEGDERIKLSAYQYEGSWIAYQMESINDS